MPVTLAHRTAMKKPVLHDDTEVALMLRVQANDPDAFGELVKLVRPRVFGRLVKLLRNRQDAEDLTQDVYLRLYRSRDRYIATAKFSTWLYHITTNVARNALRHRRRHARLQFTSFEEGPGQHSGAAMPSDRLERLELGELLREAMERLMARQRHALEMHEFQHQSYAAIAVTLSMTPEAIKSLLYRARLQMRAYLQRSPEMT